VDVDDSTTPNPCLEGFLGKGPEVPFSLFSFTSLFDCSRQVNTLRPLAVLSHGQVGTADIKSHVASFLRFCVTMTTKLNKQQVLKFIKIFKHILMTIILLGETITASKLTGSSEPE